MNEVWKTGSKFRQGRSQDSNQYSAGSWASLLIKNHTRKGNGKQLFQTAFETTRNERNEKLPTKFQALEKYLKSIALKSEDSVHLYFPLHQLYRTVTNPATHIESRIGLIASFLLLHVPLAPPAFTCHSNALHRLLRYPPVREPPAAAQRTNQCFSERGCCVRGV